MRAGLICQGPARASEEGSQTDVVVLHAQTAPLSGVQHVLRERAHGGHDFDKSVTVLSSRYTRHTDAFSCNMKRDVCFCFDSSLHIVSIYSAVRAAPSRAGATHARHTTHTDVSHDLRDTLGRNTELRYFAYSTNTVLHSGSRLASHCIMSLNAPTGTEPSASPNRSLLLPLLVLRL